MCGHVAHVDEIGSEAGLAGAHDGGLNYLYEFMDKCDALNYRVDFVALHFYRGGQTPWNLYSFVKGVHDRTGRPIWIPNGTTEPTGPAKAGLERDDQQAKQLRDMKAFFDVLDTALLLSVMLCTMRGVQTLLAGSRQQQRAYTGRKNDARLQIPEWPTICKRV
jgi:hypothetical protein